MIPAKDAYLNSVSHQVRKPITNLKTIAEMIRVSSMLGYESIQFFIKASDSVKIKTKLRKSGYLIDTTIISSLPDEEMIEVLWARSEFVGEIQKKIKGD